MLLAHLSDAHLATGALVISAPSTRLQVHLDLGPLQRLAFVDEPPGILLHHLRGPTAVTHPVPGGALGAAAGTTRQAPPGQSRVLKWRAARGMAWTQLLTWSKPGRVPTVTSAPRRRSRSTDTSTSPKDTSSSSGLW